MLMDNWISSYIFIIPYRIWKHGGILLAIIMSCRKHCIRGKYTKNLSEVARTPCSIIAILFGDNIIMLTNEQSYKNNNYHNIACQQQWFLHFSVELGCIRFHTWFSFEIKSLHTTWVNFIIIIEMLHKNNLKSTLGLSVMLSLAQIPTGNWYTNVS